MALHNVLVMHTMCEVFLPLTHTHTHPCALLHKLPRADFTASHRGGWGVDNNLKPSLNCLCGCVADCVCAGLHRGSRMCLTRCSPPTPPRNRSTTPVPSRLSKVSRGHIVFAFLLSKISEGHKRETASTSWITVSLGLRSIHWLDALAAL